MGTPTAERQNKSSAFPVLSKNALLNQLIWEFYANPQVPFSTPVPDSSNKKAIWEFTNFQPVPKPIRPILTVRMTQ